MLTPPFLPRPVGPADHETVEALLQAAFAGPGEAALVRRLRDEGAMAAEWITDAGPGYAALSRMVAPRGWLCLAPVAVNPGWQGRGIGQAVTRHAVAMAGAATVVVLGEPAFYERCGFSLLRAQRLTSPYPLTHTLIARPGDDVPAESLVYPAAFGEG